MKTALLSSFDSRFARAVRREEERKGSREGKDNIEDRT